MDDDNVTESGQPLVVGGFYWVWAVLDPDAASDWENRPMPARYAGDGKWNFLNEHGVSDWPVRWIGEKLAEPPHWILVGEALEPC